MTDLQTIIPALRKYNGAPLRVLGIDLGTTNSSVAEITFDPNVDTLPQIRCIPIEQADGNTIYTDELVPSVVAIWQNEIVVGVGAKLLQRISSIYRLEQNRCLFIECKNDIGVKRTYFRAPEGFRNAAEIGGKILSFLIDQSAADTPPTRTVITVPASFQSAQRNDTRKAAKIAGLELEQGDLFDEPVAAFVDFMFNYAGKDDIELDKPKNVLVFDFGGGTCDVAVFRLAPSSTRTQPTIAPISVSRYHRLGGGDIDAAIVYDVLIPQLCDQNNIAVEDLDFDDKKMQLEPVLKPVAEELKKAICRNQTQPFVICERKFSVIINGKLCKLTDPVLRPNEFEQVLEPFLDQELLCARDTEYRLTCSVFAPIADVLERCDMNRDDIDILLLAGGSSLIPQVDKAVGEYFRKAKVLRYPDALTIQTTVARGAAYQALALAVSGHGVITPVSQDSLSIKTEQGPVEIVPQGEMLPYPARGFGVLTDLAAPGQGMLDTLKIRVEIQAGKEGRSVFSNTWPVDGLVNKGDPITLKYRYDENQILSLEMAVNDGVEHGCFKAEIENPLTHIINPNRTWIKILATEEELRTNDLTDKARFSKMEELGSLYAEMGQREKAISVLKKVLRYKNDADPDIINQIGILYGELGNKVTQERMYRQASKVDIRATSPMFNLALLLERQGRLADSLQTLEAALKRTDDAPFRVLKGLVLQKMGNDSEGKKVIADCVSAFRPVTVQSNWELGWYKTAVELLEKQDKVQAAEQEFSRRKLTKELLPEGVLPVCMKV